MPLDGSTILDKTGVEILEALELLRKDGWCINLQYDDKGRRCALGAVFRVFGPPERAQDYNLPVVQRLAAATGIFGIDNGSTVTTYNNAQTDFAVIEDWFLRAAYAGS